MLLLLLDHYRQSFPKNWRYRASSRASLISKRNLTKFSLREISGVFRRQEKTSRKSNFSSSSPEESTVEAWEGWKRFEDGSSEEAGSSNGGDITDTLLFVEDILPDRLSVRRLLVGSPGTANLIDL